MKRIFETIPENSDYARFPVYVHDQVEKDGAVIEEIRQLSPVEIISRFSGPRTPDSSDNSGRIYPSSRYKDNFAEIDELESRIDNINVESQK